MSESPRNRSAKDPSPPAQDARQARLAAALRANLHKRKCQQRARTNLKKTGQTDDNGGPVPSKAS